MEDFAQIAQKNFRSNMDIIRLHAQLNDELEKLHKFINKMKALPFTDTLHFEHERIAITQTIRHINKCIQSLIKEKRK